MKSSQPEQVLDPRTHPAITLDGPEHHTQTSYLGTTIFNRSNRVELTEVEYLRLQQQETDRKVADLTTDIQRLAQESHDIRRQGIVRTQ